MSRQRILCPVITHVMLPGNQPSVRVTIEIRLTKQQGVWVRGWIDIVEGHPYHRLCQGKTSRDNHTSSEVMKTDVLKRPKTKVKKRRWWKKGEQRQDEFWGRRACKPWVGELQMVYIIGFLERHHLKDYLPELDQWQSVKATYSLAAGIHLVQFSSEV